MSQTVFGAQATVTFLNRAFNNTAPGNLLFQNQVGAAGTTRESQEAFARTFANSFSALSDEELSTLVLTNMGVLPSEEESVLALETELAAYFEANAPADRGLIVLQLSEILAGLEGSTGDLEVYASAAAAWNNEIAKSFEHSVTIGSVTADPLEVPPVDPNPIQNYTLTTAQDVLSGTEGANTIRGVAGASMGNQDQTTLNSSDIIDGKGGDDTLIVLLNGNYGGGATLKSVETLQIGTNNAGAVQFDYNVNQGNYEVTGVNTVVYDQITAGETLNVVNITPSATGDVIPTLHWNNEPGSTAGTAGVTFREASVVGATTLNVVLDDVSGGVLNIGTAARAAGVETIKITSQGSTANTLNPSANADGSNFGAVDIVASSEGDAANNGSLTKVIIEGAQALGKAAGIVSAAGATQGLTDRAVGIDGGISAAATAANLLSVAATVTEVDASAATGDVSVRFTARNNGAEVSQVFKGGEANDYVEFEVGNVNATGGKGNDTFAFVNGGFNSSLTVADTLDGGEGVDTLQIGVNGAASAGQQTYTLDWTEFNNKTGIDVLDLRGNVNTVTLSDDFVAAADAGLTVRTDKIVQTSATDTANPATSTAFQEDNSVNTINLTKLAAGRAITVEGGSGSDRVVVNEQSLTASSVIRGGTNVGNNGGGAVAGDYDTITVVDNAVLSRGDLSNVSGIEGIALVKSDNTSGRQVSLEITQTFLTNNTQATDVVAGTSALTDTVFSVVTGNAANANILGIGDTVTIDVSDLYTGGLVANGLKSGIGARTIDVSSLVAAGVTVVYRDASAAPIAAPAVITGAAAVAASADAVIVLGSAALNVNNVPVGNVMTALAPGFSTATGFMVSGSNMATMLDDTLNSTVANLAGSTVNMGGGNDTLNVTGAVDAGNVAGLNAALAAAVGVESVVLQAGSTANVLGAAGQNITAQAASIFTLAAGATGTGSAGDDRITTSAGANTVVVGGGGNDTVVSMGGTDNITTGAGNDTILLGAGNATVATGAGADTVTHVMTGLGDRHTVDLGAADGAVDTVNIVNAAIVQANADLITVRGFSTANDVFSLMAGVVTPTSNGVFINEATGAVGSTPVVNLGTGTILEISSASYQFSGQPDLLNEAALLAHMAGTMGVTGAAGAQITVVVYDGSGNAAILQAIENTAGGSAFDAVELVGVVQGGVEANSFTAANFA